MLKSMRDATVKSDLFDSSQMDTYQGMADQQLALKLAEGGGIGLARMMVEQMQSKGYVGDEVKTQEAAKPQLAIETDIQGFRLRAADAYENGSKD